MSAVSVSLRLPSEVLERLQNLVTLTGRSKTFYMTEAISQHLDDLEDIYLAERELENIRAGRSTTTPLSEVVKSYDLGG